MFLSNFLIKFNETHNLINWLYRHGLDYAFSPRSLDLEITMDCNLNCIMCHRRRIIKVDKGNLSLDKFKHILEQLPKLRHINIVGRGEPLMNPSFFKMLNIAKSKGIEVTITTNGTLLNKNNIKRLSNNLSIYVSVDSPYPKKYEMIKKGARFENLVKNLTKLRELKPEIMLCIQAVIMKDTVEELPELIIFAKKVGADKVSLIHILALNNENDKRHGINHERIEYYLQKTEEMAKIKKVELISRPICPKLRKCTSPWFQPYIILNGDVYPCCFAHCKEWFFGVSAEVPLYQYRMGNIFKDSFGKIWNNKRFKLIRRVIRSSEKAERLSLEELNHRRREIDLNEKFAYCRICLQRWSLVC